MCALYGWPLGGQCGGSGGISNSQYWSSIISGTSDPQNPNYWYTAMSDGYSHVFDKTAALFVACIR
ncbi:hypothetical protein D3C85_1816820 [compost metagenome]